MVSATAAGSVSCQVVGDVVRGKELYSGCAACHGMRGEGNAVLRARALAQGSDWYQVAQLDNFMRSRSGVAATDAAGTQMRAAAPALPDPEAVRDVVAYINTLR